MDKRKKRTKLAFHQALLSLLQYAHFDHITITQIVQTAEYNRGTFYFHYEQKEDLLEEMISMRLHELKEAFKKTYEFKSKEVSIEELKPVHIFEHCLKHKTFYQTMLSNHINHNFYERLVSLMETHFKEDILFMTEQNQPVDMKLFYKYRVHGMIGVIVSWIKEGFTQDSDFMAEQLVQIAIFHTKRVQVKRENH